MCIRDSPVIACEVAARCGGVRMIGAQRLLLHRQSALPQRHGERDAVGAAIKLGEVIQGGRYARMVCGERALANAPGALHELLGLLILPRGPRDRTEIEHRFGRDRVLGTETALADLQLSLIHISEPTRLLSISYA